MTSYPATNSGVEITQITGINDSNEIVGFYMDADGVQRGFAATAAPEPASMLLNLGWDRIGVAIQGRKRRP